MEDGLDEEGLEDGLDEDCLNEEGVEDGLDEEGAGAWRCAASNGGGARARPMVNIGNGPLGRCTPAVSLFSSWH
jgi:hypothetical protein